MRYPEGSVALPLGVAGDGPSVMECGCWRCEGRDEDGTLHATVEHTRRLAGNRIEHSVVADRRRDDREAIALFLGKYGLANTSGAKHEARRVALAAAKAALRRLP